MIYVNTAVHPIKCPSSIEQVETLQQSGSYSALSTRLKQQKLYDVFPGIDTTVLDDIFQANW